MGTLEIFPSVNEDLKKNKTLLNPFNGTSAVHGIVIKIAFTDLGIGGARKSFSPPILRIGGAIFIIQNK